MELPLWYHPCPYEKEALRIWSDRLLGINGFPRLDTVRWLDKCPSWFNKSPKLRAIDRTDTGHRLNFKHGPPEGFGAFFRFFGFRFIEFGYRVTGGYIRDEAAARRIDNEIKKEVEWIASSEGERALGSDLSNSARLLLNGSESSVARLGQKKNQRIADARVAVRQIR